MLHWHLVCGISDTNQTIKGNFAAAAAGNAATGWDMRRIERPKSLAASALERLRQSIVQGDLGLGQPISERQLAESLGVSKTPVREALAQLRVEGLIQILPQKGAFVFTLSAKDIVYLCELRLTLESSALKLAYQRNREKLIHRLKAVLAHMIAAQEKQDTRSYLHCDTQFHEVFFATCGNPLLEAAYATHVGKIAALRTHLAMKPLHTVRSFEEHAEMIRLLENGAIAGAISVLEQHIGRTSATYSESVDDIAEADKSNGVAA
jgi:DNA-binding GntR family transcriptional regulator